MPPTLFVFSFLELGPGFWIRFTVHYNLCIGTIAGLGEPRNIGHCVGHCSAPDLSGTSLSPDTFCKYSFFRQNFFHVCRQFCLFLWSYFRFWDKSGTLYCVRDFSFKPYYYFKINTLCLTLFFIYFLFDFLTYFLHFSSFSYRVSFFLFQSIFNCGVH